MLNDFLTENVYPSTDLANRNLDFMIRDLRKMMAELKTFVSINSVKYADPIRWDITRQYEKNTIVIDPLTGTAYISVAAVPIGVALTRTEYWTPVFDLEQFVTKGAKNFTSRFEEQTTLTATFSTPVNGWLVWNSTLYRALTNIVAGDQYVPDSNIKQFTIEDVIGHIEDLNTFNKDNLIAAINEVLNNIGSLSSLQTADTSSIVNAINEIYSYCVGQSNLIGTLEDLNTTDKSNLVNAINEVLSELDSLKNKVGDLSSLQTTDTSSIVNAINEIYGYCVGQSNLIGTLEDLNTTDKSNLVNAINEVNAKPTGDLKIADRHILFVMDSLGNLKDTGNRYVDEAIQDLTGAACYRVAQNGASFLRGEFTTLVNNYAGNTDIIDTIVLIGGGNDQADTESEVITGANTFFAACHAKFPNAHDYFVMAPGLTFSTLQNPSFTVQNRESVWKYYKKAAFLNGAKYADNSQYILRNTTLLSSDFTHPTPSGMNTFISYIRDYLCNGYINVYYELDTQYHSVGNVWTYNTRMTRDNGICTITFSGGLPAFCIADVVNDTTGNTINVYGTFDDSLVDTHTSTGINDIGGICLYIDSGNVYMAIGSIFITEKSAQGFILRIDPNSPASGTDLKFITENYTLHN